MFSWLGVQSWVFTKQKFDHVTDCFDSRRGCGFRVPWTWALVCFDCLCCRQTATLSPWGEPRPLLIRRYFGFHWHVLLCITKISIHAMKTKPDLTFRVASVLANSGSTEELNIPVSPPHPPPSSLLLCCVFVSIEMCVPMTSWSWFPMTSWCL